MGKKIDADKLIRVLEHMKSERGVNFSEMCAYQRVQEFVEKISKEVVEVGTPKNPGPYYYEFKKTVE